MRISLVLPLLFISLVVFSQKSPGIEYAQADHFHWGLFRGRINPQHIAEMGKNTGAVTVSSLSYRTLRIDGRSATIKITAQFHPNESWTRYPKLNNPGEALIHEKKHFDICEIYARKLRQAIKETRFTRHKFNDQLNDLFKKVAADQRDAQELYDGETNHSIDKAQQREWNERIAQLLKSLEDHADTVVTVMLN